MKKTSKPLNRTLLISHKGFQENPKRPWVWVLVECGKPEYTSWRSFSSKSKAEAHFFSGHHGMLRGTIKVEVVK